jgi:hypothetical protein
MRTTLTTAAVVGLLAAGAGTAAARPELPGGRDDAALHSQALRTQAAHSVDLRNAAPSGSSAPAPIVRVTRAPLVDGGFDWADAGIGAGLAAALLLSAAGASVLRRERPATR